MIELKTAAELETMLRGGQIAAQVLRDATSRLEPGPTTSVDRFVEKRIRRLKAVPSFKGFEGYPYSTCININQGVVHGLPSSEQIKEGDVVSVDLGVFYRGFHTDCAWTVLLGGQVADTVSFNQRKKFLQVGRLALAEAVRECRPGQRVGDISFAMQRVVEGAGFSVVRDLVGHGVGRNLHEEPQIPCFGRRGTGRKLEEGMVLAVEVIYALGNPKLKVLADGWTIVTEDASIAGLFEHTVAVTLAGPKVLTTSDMVLTPSDMVLTRGEPRHYDA